LPEQLHAVLNARRTPAPRTVGDRRRSCGNVPGKVASVALPASRRDSPRPAIPRGGCSESTPARGQNTPGASPAARLAAPAARPTQKPRSPRPQLTVEGAVADGLGDVPRLNVRRLLQSRWMELLAGAGQSLAGPPMGVRLGVPRVSASPKPP